MGIIILLLALVILALVGVVWIAVVLFYTRVPFVKTPQRNIGVLLKEIPFSSKDVVYDLGCGDAHVLIAIEKASGARTIGYELSPFAYLKARWNVKKAKSNTQIFFQDFRKADVRNATVVFVFLITGIMNQTWTWLLKHAQPGTIIVSYGFTFPNVTPERVVQTSEDPSKSKLYFYRTTKS